MKCQITIDCKNAAFHDADTDEPAIGHQLAWIFQDLAARIVFDSKPDDEDFYVVYDANGNSVGKLEFVA